MYDSLVKQVKWAMIPESLCRKNEFSIGKIQENSFFKCVFNIKVIKYENIKIKQ